jgi:predicted nucleic acid-binding protein
MNVIADTGFLVALVRDYDQYHDWADEISERIAWPVITCEAVLAETAFHLRSALAVMEMLQEHVVSLAFDCDKHIDSLHQLAARYADRQPDLADLCLIRMSELYPRHTVLTTDEADFRVFRRNKREVIPILCPPHRK